MGSKTPLHQASQQREPDSNPLYVTSLVWTGKTAQNEAKLTILPHSAQLVHPQEMLWETRRETYLSG